MKSNEKRKKVLKGLVECKYWFNKYCKSGNKEDLMMSVYWSKIVLEYLKEIELKGGDNV